MSKGKARIQQLLTSFVDQLNREWMVLQMFAYHAASSTLIWLCMGCFWNTSYFSLPSFVRFVLNSTSHPGLSIIKNKNKKRWKLVQKWWKTEKWLPSCLKHLFRSESQCDRITIKAINRLSCVHVHACWKTSCWNDLSLDS